MLGKTWWRKEKNNLCIESVLLNEPFEKWFAEIIWTSQHCPTAPIIPIYYQRDQLYLQWTQGRGAIGWEQHRSDTKPRIKPGHQDNSRSNSHGHPRTFCTRTVISLETCIWTILFEHTKLTSCLNFQVMFLALFALFVWSMWCSPSQETRVQHWYTTPKSASTVSYIQHGSLSTTIHPPVGMGLSVLWILCCA